MVGDCIGMHPLLLIVILSVVQGFAEFLPISSSGHLVILAAFLTGEGSDIDIADLNIVLHFGTLLSILVFYWRQIRAMLWEDRRVLGMLTIGTIPAIIVGLPMKKWGKWLLEDPALAGILLLVTAGVLLVVAKMRHRDRDYRTMGLGQTLLVGIAQAVAILPGISRSGMTIAAGLGLGLSRGSAATFSFLLAIPAICGAMVLELKDFATGEVQIGTPWQYLLVGIVISFLVGLVALWWLVRWLERGLLVPFACWCVGMSLVAMFHYGLPGSHESDPPSISPADSLSFERSDPVSRLAWRHFVDIMDMGPEITGTHRLVDVIVIEGPIPSRPGANWIRPDS